MQSFCLWLRPTAPPRIKPTALAKHVRPRCPCVVIADPHPHLPFFLPPLFSSIFRPLLFVGALRPGPGRSGAGGAAAAEAARAQRVIRVLPHGQDPQEGQSLYPPTSRLASAPPPRSPLYTSSVRTLQFQGRSCTSSDLHATSQLIPLTVYSIGYYHPQLKQFDRAMLLFSWAMDLDPKGSGHLFKETIAKHLSGDDSVNVSQVA